MSRGKILIIEDDRWWMEEFRGMFHKHPDLRGFEMVEAFSFADARAFFSKKL